MACGCGQTQVQVYKVIPVGGGAEKTFSTAEDAQAEINANGGRMRVAYERKIG